MSRHEIILTDRGLRENSALTTRDIIEVGARRRGSFTFWFTVVFLGAVVAAMVMPKRYESETKILVHRERADPLVTAQQTAAVEQNMPGLTEEDINSEVSILRSQDLLEKVAAACGLQHMEDGSPLFRWIKIGASPDADDEQLAIRKAGEKLGKDLRIEPVKKSFVISVRYSATNPELAAKVLNTLGNLYLEKHAEVHRPKDVVGFFDQETEEYRKTMVEAKERLAEFNRTSGIVTSQTEKDSAVPKLAEFELGWRQTQAAIPGGEEHVRSLQALLEKTPPRITTQLHNSDNGALMQQLKSSLVSLESQRVDLRNKYAPGDRMVQEVDTQIEQVKAAIDAQQKAPLKEETTDQNPTYEFLRQELAKSQAELAATKARAQSLGSVDQAYRRTLVERDQKQLQQEALLRDAKIAEDNYLLYLNKREQAHISDAFDKNRILNVSIAQPATIALRPTNPTWLILLLGWLSACLASTGIVLVQEQLNPTLKRPEQIERYFEVPILADISGERDGGNHLFTHWSSEKRGHSQ
ncbi:MAG TPA: GumC family protein [Candidatus Limnocylindrales bacterium]|nr:GumC family protein [Candidatus Limnocylindrales bacterium]